MERTGRVEGGLAELAAYDLNGDGVIDIQDAVWGDLQVWRDLHQDGASDASELKSLDELGIVSLEEVNSTDDSRYGVELQQNRSLFGANNDNAAWPVRPLILEKAA